MSAEQVDLPTESSATPVYFPHFIKWLTFPLSAFLTMLSQHCQNTQEYNLKEEILIWLMILEVSVQGYKVLLLWALLTCRASWSRAGGRGCDAPFKLARSRESMGKGEEDG